jgi:hypothetical protein
MSGGYIHPQGKFEHQVVIFTFAGGLSQANVKAWNDAVRDLKTRFKGQVMGVTVKGEPTPSKMRPSKKKK